MSIRERVLQAALRLCNSRGGWRFSPAEVVGALSDLNAASVRTHVMSRCCVNAPAHHSHRWPYFRRVRRGIYEVVPAYRSAPKRGRTPDSAGAGPAGPVFEICERAGRYEARAPGGSVFRAASLDAVASEVRRRARTHTDDDDPTRGRLDLFVRLEIPADTPDPVIEAYARHVDRTQIRRNLGRSPSERLAELQQWIEAMDEMQGAARRPRP